MSSLLIKRECGHCGNVVNFIDVVPDGFRCPECLYAEWLYVYALSENDRRFLHSLRIEPVTSH